MNLSYNLKPESAQNDMRIIATDLMNNWILLVGEAQYRLCEIEFYYRQEQGHNDPFLHGHDLQKRYGRWYFHGSGLDLTIGSADYSASILIRAICNLNDPAKHYHYGPLNVISEIFKSFGTCDLHKIDIGFEEDHYQSLTYEMPIAAKRIGLNPAKDQAMHNSLYRFLILPKQKHADKTGIEEAMKNSGEYTAEQIKGIWG